MKMSQCNRETKSIYVDIALLLAMLSSLNDGSQPAYTVHYNMSHFSRESNPLWMPSHPCTWLMHCCYELLSPRVAAHISNVFVAGPEGMEKLKEGRQNLRQLGQQFKHLLAWQPGARILWQILRKELAGLGSRLQSLFRGSNSSWTADSERIFVIDFIPSSAAYK